MAVVALHDSDGTKYPNLALMKLAAWHKARGDTVERFMPILHSARRGQKDFTVYSSNVLAHPHGIAQIEKMARLDLRVDFNQGLDARLIDDAIARRLAALRWIRFIRMACDHKSQMPEVERVIRLLRAVGGHYREYFCYVLVKDVDDAHDRVLFLESLNVTPFAQPYRDWESTEPTYMQKCFAGWCNRPPIRKTTPWPEYWAQRQHGMVANG